MNTLLTFGLRESYGLIDACERAELIQGVVKLIHPLPMGAMVKGEHRGMKIEVQLRDINQKKPEQYETVRAFELSVYVASLSSVSRCLELPGYPTPVFELSISTESLAVFCFEVAESLDRPIGLKYLSMNKAETEILALHGVAKTFHHERHESTKLRVLVIRTLRVLRDFVVS